MDTSSANTEPATDPFSGLLVIDLTHVLNGPFGTTLLTDLGARVVKIEPPGHADDTRTYGPFYKDQSLYFSFVNRSKESIKRGTYLTIGSPIKFSNFAPKITGSPLLGEHTDDVLAKLGYSRDQVAKLHETHVV
jgi:CoA:oxalate CoA-transferase